MDWQEILEDIRDEQAVLFLGPELIRLEGQSLGQHVREQLHREYPDDIVHHYRRDGIFLFRDDDAKVKIQKKVKRRYRELPPDEDLLQRVAALPFHLIISLSPDTFVRDVFEACGLQPHFHFYRSGVSPEDIPKPDKNHPLIYNLLGEINHDESLVLDYDDVFALMKDCLSTGLPSRINTQLMRAGTFVFLGFDFEKWHTQLLLRFLSQRPGVSKFAIETDRPVAEDTGDFLIHQFRINFQAGENGHETFFDTLHAHCAQEDMLRTIVNRYADVQTRLLRLVHNGKLAQAITELLQRYTDPDTQTELTLHAARLSGLTTQQQAGAIDSRDYFVEWNKIALAVILLIKNLPA